MNKILVVEDDKFLSSAYRAKLSKSDFEVELARDGSEALEILKKFTPDIILLDLVMPVMDGFATLEEIKKIDKLRKIPVIVASNLGQKEDLDKATALGADDYIIKSDMSLAELVAKLEGIIENK